MLQIISNLILFVNLCAYVLCKALCFVFFSFLCDYLLLQKFVQSLCGNTVILCVNLVDSTLSLIPKANSKPDSRDIIYIVL